jgi:hypothetical protein
MPCNYKDYPANWKQIIAEKKRKHNDKCEMCYAKNGDRIKWLDDSFSHPWCLDDTGTKIVLTVHHIDGDKNNNREQNLLLLCQRHHLRLDLCKHMRKAKETREKKKGFMNIFKEQNEI